MPSRPLRKSIRLDKLVERFAVMATDFDELLPECYRFSGRPPTKDARANAWARADEHIILAADALNSLQAVLSEHAPLSVAKRNGKSKATAPWPAMYSDK